MTNRDFMRLAILENLLTEKRGATKYLYELQLKGLWSHLKHRAE